MTDKRLVGELLDRHGRTYAEQVAGIGPVGADIFCREAQGLWPELAPAPDGKVLAGAGRLGLPRDPERLATLVPAAHLPRFSAALVRVALDGKADGVLRAARD